MKNAGKIATACLTSAAIGALVALVAIGIHHVLSSAMNPSIWWWIVIAALGAAGGGATLSLLSDEDQASKLLDRLPPTFVFPAFIFLMVSPIIAAAIESKDKFAGWDGVAVIAVLSLVLVITLALALRANHSDAEQVLGRAYAIELLDPPILVKLFTYRGRLTERAVLALGFKIQVWQNTEKLSMEKIAKERLQCDIEILRHINRLFIQSRS